MLKNSWSYNVKLFQNCMTTGQEVKMWHIVSIKLPFCFMSSGTHIPALYQCENNSGSVDIPELYHIGLDKASVGLSVFVKEFTPTHQNFFPKWV